MRILLIDGSNYLYRGFYAVQNLSTNKGVPTNAIKGMLSIILADMSVLRPDGIVVVFDRKKKGVINWRTKLYPEYKGTRDKDKAKEVRSQEPHIRKILKAMGIRRMGIAGVEADDIIGTLATQLSAEGHEVLVSSKDKDFAVLVSKSVKMVEATTRRILGRKDVQEKFGVKTTQMLEYLMLLGDGSDNIPGVYKCGSKTAAKLLNNYGTIKEVLANVDELTPALRKNILEAKKNFKLTRKLISLDLNVKNSVTAEKCRLRAPDIKALNDICKELELKETHKHILRALK